MQPRTKLFVILWIAGMTGILSLLLVDLCALLRSLPVTAGKEMPFPPLIMGVLSLIQPTVLMSLAVVVGTTLAHKVRLSAPVAEAAAAQASLVSALRPQIFSGVIGGIVGGIAILASWVLWKPFLPTLFVIEAEKFNRFMPFLTRLLYGGITEELLLRWGVMTLLVWVSWRLFQGGQGRPRAIYFVCAIVISAVIFGIGHLPIAVALGAGFTIPIVAYIIIANSIFGLIAGYLYWQKGLEAAIIAHMSAHLIIMTAMYVGT
jgi:hypothetical protein